MTWKDTLEIGLKDDAPFRRDNLPDFQKNGARGETMPADPTRSPEEPGARQDAELPAAKPASRSRARRSAAQATRGPLSRVRSSARGK